MKARALGFLIVLLVLPVLAFASGQTPAASAKVIEIRYMSPWVEADPNGPVFGAMVRKFNAEHPNIKVVPDLLPSANLRTKITVEMAANNPPHAAWSILSYAREFTRADKLMDWAPVYNDPKHKEYKEWFDEKVLKTPTYMGIIMMSPFEAHVDGFIYNEALFQKLGMTVPTTGDELIAVAKKSKAQGIAASVTGGKTMRFAWLASILLARTGGFANAQALALGDAMNKWNDPKYGFPQAMQKFKAFVDAGGYPDGVLGMDQNESYQVFGKGKALTYYEGQWVPSALKTAGGDEFIKGVRRANFPKFTDMPNGDPDIMTGGIIAGQIVAKQYSEAERQATILWCKTVSSPELMVRNMELGNNIYAGKAPWNDANATTLWKQTVAAFRAAPRFIPSMDTFAPPPVDLAIKQTAMPGLITGQFTVDQAVAEVQKAAVEYLKTIK